MVTDLVVVGAGPCGLLSALLARKSGLSCVVIERRSEGQFFGHAHYLNQYSLRILAMAGVDVDSLAKKATPIESALQMSFCTTFAQTFARVSCFDDPLFRAVWDHADRHGVCLNVRFEDLMQALLVACHQAQVSILWGCVFDHYEEGALCSSSPFSSSPSSSSSLCKLVACQADDIHVFHADLVLACDGAKSSVATSLGVERQDHKVWQHFLSVEVKADFSSFLTSPSMLVWIYHPNIQACLVVHNVKSYQVLQIPVASGVTEKDLCHDSLRDALHTLCNLPPSESLPISFGVVKSWSMQTFVLPSLLNDKVVFLGDSAHAMTPAGGLGLNTAFADAANLIWKIAHAQKMPADYWLFSYDTERTSVAKNNVQYSIDNYRDFLSVPRFLGYDLLGSYGQKMLNTNILRSSDCKCGKDKKGSVTDSWVSKIAYFAQCSLQGNRFICEYLAQATASNLKHFRGLDQHLGFCYRTELIDNPQRGLGDYTLDYDIIYPGRMIPAVKLRLCDSKQILFAHELLVYPKWCLLSQEKGDLTSLFPLFLQSFIDVYCYGEHYVWEGEPPQCLHANLLLLRPDGIVAFLGNKPGLIAYLSKLHVCVGVHAHGGDGGD